MPTIAANPNLARMIRRDYVQRLIEQLGAAVAAVARKAMTPEQILVEVQAAKGALPLVPGLLETASTELLLSTLQERSVIELLARLYRAEGQALKELGRIREATRSLERSLQLLDAVSQTGFDQSATE